MDQKAIALALGLALLGTTPVYADDDAQAAGGSATRVYINPQTGKLGGPPPDVTPPGLSVAEQKMLSRSDRGLQQRQLPNGTILLDLQGRFRNMSTATVTADGTPQVRCSDNEAAVEHALQAPAGGESQ